MVLGHRFTSNTMTQLKISSSNVRKIFIFLIKQTIYSIFNVFLIHLMKKMHKKNKFRKKQIPSDHIDYVEPFCDAKYSLYFFSWVNCSFSSFFVRPLLIFSPLTSSVGIPCKQISIKSNQLKKINLKLNLRVHQKLNIYRFLVKTFLLD